LIPLNTPAVLTFPGDGTEQITFPISFPTFEQSNVEVEVVTPTSELIVLQNGTHYLLLNIGIPNTDASLILAVSPSFEWTAPNGLKDKYTLNIKFTTNAEQPAKLRDLGRFAPEVFEKVLDRLTMNILAIRQLAVDVKEQFLTLVDKVLALEEKDKVLEDKIEDIEEDIEGIKEEIEEVKADIEGVKEDIEGVKEDIEGIEENIEGIEEDIENLDSRIDNVELSLLDIEIKKESFNANFSKVYVVVDKIESYLGNGISGTFEVPFVFNPLTLSVKVLSPTLEETLLIQGSFPNDYEISGNFVNLLGGPNKPWLADGGFGGLEVGWTLVLQDDLDVEINLPAPEKGKVIYIKKLNTNLLTLIRSGSEQIDHVAANKSLTSAKESVTLISDGVNWFII
jgi:prefoldin subunit 5